MADLGQGTSFYMESQRRVYNEKKNPGLNLLNPAPAEPRAPYELLNL